ncbi:aspartate/glutamate racemase family protein [Mesorhizobium sp. YR577]|uniref:aspartate/glutamate racemase family protein n=1 Tax=Mesorhizobium sp. YR577 TaxID=1884373 RepID=UPI0008F019D0|nr:aspartate/glutamate racemase family protein [Mesorhizobium sp. YR577]SFU19388.1 Asp/Glu/hydantoin racemase [Mesorhizobium sp. YR577]
MSRLIHVINASSRTDTGITEDIAKSLAWTEAERLPAFNCLTLADGPNGISTARDSDDAAPAVLRFIEREAARTEVAGFVVACFSDPGVHAARGLTGKPVAGIGEAGFAAALSLGDLIGTIGVAAGRGAKSMRLARHMGIAARIAGHRGLGLTYDQLQHPDFITERAIEAGKALREDGAEVLLFAGAGLARYVAPVEKAVGLPVIDPTQAAAGIVLAQIMQSASRA